MKKEWEARLKENSQTVDEGRNCQCYFDDVRHSGTTYGTNRKSIKLAGMKEDLQAKVIAQDPAIEKLVKAILSRVGLKALTAHWNVYVLRSDRRG